MIYLRCEVCGELFVPSRLTMKYCSDECRKISNNERGSDYYEKNKERLKRLSSEWYRRNRRKKGKEYRGRGGAKYYCKVGNSYRVQKWINGRSVHFCSVWCEEDAKLCVEHLKKNNWNKDCLKEMVL